MRLRGYVREGAPGGAIPLGSEHLLLYIPIKHGRHFPEPRCLCQALSIVIFVA